MKPTDVLIIDDEKDLCDVMTLSLTRAGYTVTAAYSAAMAEEVLKHFIPPVILSDIKMPGKTGLEFVADLKSNRLPCAVVMVTAYAETELLLEAMRLGCVDYITKPYKMERILDCLPLWMEIGKTLQKISSGNIPSEVEKGIQIIDTIRVKANLLSKRKAS